MTREIRVTLTLFSAENRAFDSVRTIRNPIARLVTELLLSLGDALFDDIQTFERQVILHDERRRHAQDVPGRNPGQAFAKGFLIDEPPRLLKGFSRNYVPVLVDGKDDLMNQEVPVRIVAVNGTEVKGKI